MILPKTMTLELHRFQGCLMGLAVGDAIGTTVEFFPRGSFDPVTDMQGGGPFGLDPGQWTDDTSMALCLAESLVENVKRETTGAARRVETRRPLSWFGIGRCCP